MMAYRLEEADGITRFAFDAELDGIDTEETYLPAFKACVEEAQVHSIMCSYNAVNGTPACTSPDVLGTTLRQSFGFDGFVVSDCGAIGYAYTAHHFAKVWRARCPCQGATRLTCVCLWSFCVTVRCRIRVYLRQLHWV